MCIWFPDAMAGCTAYGIFHGPAVTRRSPPGCVSIVGWLLLLYPAAQIVIIAVLYARE